MSIAQFTEQYTNEDTVFGEPSMARKGLLICVPAGPENCVERIRPYLKDV